MNTTIFFLWLFSAEDGLARVNALATDLIKKSGGPGWFCLIVWLSLLALFLFFLVIYT